MKYLALLYYLPLAISAYGVETIQDSGIRRNYLKGYHRRVYNYFINSNNEQQELLSNNLMEHNLANTPVLEAKQGIFNAGNNPNEPKYAISAPDGRNLKTSPKPVNIEKDSNSNSDTATTKNKIIKDSSGADSGGGNLIVMDETGNIVKNAVVLTNQQMSALSKINTNSKGSGNNVNLVKAQPLSLKLELPEDKEKSILNINSDSNNISENFNSVESEKFNIENNYYENTGKFNQFTDQYSEFENEVEGYWS